MEEVATTVALDHGGVPTRVHADAEGAFLLLLFGGSHGSGGGASFRGDRASFRRLGTELSVVEFHS